MTQATKQCEECGTQTTQSFALQTLSYKCLCPTCYENKKEVVEDQYED